MEGGDPRRHRRTPSSSPPNERAVEDVLRGITGRVKGRTCGGRARNGSDALLLTGDRHGVLLFCGGPLMIPSHTATHASGAWNLVKPQYPGVPPLGPTPREVRQIETCTQIAATSHDPLTVI